MAKKIKMDSAIQEAVSNVVLPEAAPAPKKRSQAWKGLEYAIAAALRKAGFKRARRVPKQDQMVAMTAGRELPDVYVPEVPGLQLDGKYSTKTWNAVHRLFKECQAKYELKPEDRFAMFTQQANTPLKLAHITLEFFAELCAKAYLNDGDSATWVCPRCRDKNLTTTPSGLGQELHRCPVCSLEFITPQNTRPTTEPHPVD